VTFEESLESLDPGLLMAIESETSEADRRSLLALHLACRRRHPGFRWLEIGSYLGGSLQALVRDPACEAIESIDPRPKRMQDERLGAISYPDNSTTRMLDLLAGLPGADVSKVRTHDADTEALDPASIEQPHVCFVDGEHTDEACARDAGFCLAALRGSGVVAFHDVWVIYRAVSAFADGLREAGIPHSLAYLPDSMLAIEVGPRNLLADPAVTGRQLDGGRGVLWMLRQNDRYRALLKGRRARLLRRLRILPADEPLRQ
jgi:hypothetical protein